MLTGVAVLSARAGEVKIAPAPAGETLSEQFAITVDGKPCPVYAARVGAADFARRWKAVDDPPHSAEFYDMASFVSFDMKGDVEISVTCPQAVTSVQVVPKSFGITPVVRGKTVTFRLSEPEPVTVEVNGDIFHSLHVFANPFETDVPSADDPNVIYYGPGIHEVTRVVVGDNKTVYVAPGAVVRAAIGPDEKYWTDKETGLRGYAPTFELRGKNITFRGRGIIDATGCTTHARNLLVVRGSDIRLEGVILRDSSTWTVPIRQSDRVTVRNIKLLGYRANSDGIDICNSRDVTVEKCFLRTHDDLIVVKSDRGQGATGPIVARQCVLWNQVAHALSVGAELQEDVEDVLFTDCDVIHDTGREWTLRVYHCDASHIRNIRFTNIRVEDSKKFISLWINKAVWTRDPERGHIENILFENIHATGDPLRVELQGFDATHIVENVTFRDVTLNGKPLATADVIANPFVKDVRIEP